ncbi:hypothetical protein [Streptomyces sp. NPDC056660]|uniref:hypothetical protein n=1 Tax=Streptomyces sp. NPDC056660 TaxID=3345897 RepID=UPI0036C804F3
MRRGFSRDTGRSDCLELSDVGGHSGRLGLSGAGGHSDCVGLSDGSGRSCCHGLSGSPVCRGVAVGHLWVLGSSGSSW